MGYAVSSFHLGSDSSSFSEMETSSTGSNSRSVYPSGLDDLAISFDAYKKRSSPDVVNRFQSMELYNDLSEGVGPSGAAESNEIGNVSFNVDIAAISAKLTSPGSSEIRSFSNLVHNVANRFLIKKQKSVENRRVFARTPNIVRSNSRQIDPSGPDDFGISSVSSLMPRSLEIPDSSFRIHGGGESEMDRVYRSLGVSGPDDLAISFDAWEASCKTRSSSDVVNRFQSMELYNDLSEGVGPSGVFEQTLAIVKSKVYLVPSSTYSSSTESPPICLSGSIITSWQKGQLLGQGSFGSVYEGISGDGDSFAVKEISLLDQGSQAQEYIRQLEGEISQLSKLQHQNIVRYCGTAKDESNLYIFLELVTQGSLRLLCLRYQLMDSQVSLYTREILDGLNYLHEKGFTHGDIKCANILVDASGVVKLADFGLAKVSRFNDIKSCKGTPFWMAQEVMNRKGSDGYGNLADIWSLGCTVLEMLTREIPYSDLEPHQALFQIGKGILPSLPETLSPDARDFILKCLKVNPQERPTAAELLNHPFVRRPLPVYHPPALAQAQNDD